MSLKQIANVRIGTYNFTWNGVDLGHTLDGIEVEVERNQQDLNVDKYGDYPVDKAVIGGKATIKAKFAEPVVELLNRISPEGDNRTGTAGTRVAFGAAVGALMRQYAFPLVLHPSALSLGNTTEDMTFYLAVNTENIKLAGKVKDQRVVEVIFECFVSEAYGPGRILGHFGLPDVS